MEQALREARARPGEVVVLFSDDASFGRVQAWDFQPRHGRARLRQCWLQAARQYPDAQKIYLVVDNWPVHFHRDALDVLAQDSRLELLALPTYVTWLNPIEKLWRLVRQRVTHAHPWSGDFAHFRHQVRAHLRAFQQGSPSLLRYVGLVPQ